MHDCIAYRCNPRIHFETSTYSEPLDTVLRTQKVHSWMQQLTKRAADNWLCHWGSYWKRKRESSEYAIQKWSGQILVSARDLPLQLGYITNCSSENPSSGATELRDFLTVLQTNIMFGRKARNYRVICGCLRLVTGD